MENKSSNVLLGACILSFQDSRPGINSSWWLPGIFSLSVSIATILLLQKIEPTLPTHVLHKQHTLCATVHFTFEILYDGFNVIP